MVLMNSCCFCFLGRYFCCPDSVVVKVFRGVFAAQKKKDNQNLKIFTKSHKKNPAKNINDQKNKKKKTSKES